MEESFDLFFHNPLGTVFRTPKTIGDIIFSRINGRNEDSRIILSHFENQYIEISLADLRNITAKLWKSFSGSDILSGQTVILLTFQGCNELITALVFLALAAKGCRTFLPMYSESEEFSEWISITNAKHIIIPGNEVRSLEGHDREKSEINEIKSLAAMKKIRVWDPFEDFRLDEFLNEPAFDQESGPISTQELRKVNPADDVLIVTTSGTSGRSKLVAYNHEAYYINCLAWQKAGFYDKNLLGGTGFTPLLTHTMGIRALINAIWTGKPVCLIITEWFITKPETVRYLLLKMKPQHITGGPAVYNTFLEFFRVYPEIKSFMRTTLKTLVSSGAGFDHQTAKEVYDATGLHLHNAFGTTETQQVFSTLLGHGNLSGGKVIPLGKPLPGVSIGLIRSDTDANHYRLYIKSLFGHKYCIREGRSGKEEYFDTGDIIMIDENNFYFYIRRASLDYFKDCFGVKIPVMALRDYYKQISDAVIHTEFYPVINHPGLAALLFVKEDSVDPGIITDIRIMQKIAGAIEEVNNRLINTIEPFEFQHRHICRIALINQSPPQTGKGTISTKQINSDYHDLVSRLKDTRTERSGIISTDILSHGSYKYSQYLSPLIGNLLSSLKLNYQYHRGLKDSLFTYFNGKEFEVLDAAGGYGANLLGHNNPDVLVAVNEFFSAGRISICNQLSLQDSVTLLAEKLNLAVGSETGKSYYVMFGNSGSEAVEMAIHHALFEWHNRIDKMKDQQFQIFGSSRDFDVAGLWQNNLEIIDKSVCRIIAVANSFHGYSAGARSILGNIKKRIKFARLTGITAVFIDDRDSSWREHLRQAFEESLITLEKIVQVEHEIRIVSFKISSIIAAVVEPVMGEGGIRTINDDFLRELSVKDFPLISDEVQCGLGRTGNFPECRYASYYIFGKALGGGVEKLSSLMIEKVRYCTGFAEYYTSTFGNGELAATAGIKTLEIISSPEFLPRIREAGKYLKDSLDGIKNRYPSVLSDIQGRGLMLGVKFNKDCTAENLILRILFENEKAGYLFSAWLLNRFKIRIFPTISAPDTLRIETSAFFTRHETDRLCEAIEELCSVITGNRMYELFKFLMDDDPFAEESGIKIPEAYYKQYLEHPAGNAVNTSFIAHFAFPLMELRMLVPDFTKASDTGLRILFNRMQSLMDIKPARMIALNLFGGKIHFSFYVIPLDSSELEFLHKSGKRKKIVAKIQEAVNLSASNGAKIISLGGFTSILTNNGLSLIEPPGTRIITGNTLTAASGLEHLEKIIRETLVFNKQNIIAVIGSTGNIGQVIAEMLCVRNDICSELILLSRSEKRSDMIADDLIRQKHAAVKIKSTGNIYDIRDADIVIVCTNTSDPLIFPHHLPGDKPVLISDLSVPSAVDPEVTRMPNVTTIPFSAYVTLPEDNDAVISSYSPPGTLFCCAAEAILLGLEEFNGSLKGRIIPDNVKAITDLARKYNLFQKTGSIESFKSPRMNHGKPF